MLKYFAFKLVHRIAITLPRAVCYKIGIVVADINYSMKRGVRENVKANIRHILSPRYNGNVPDKIVAEYSREVFRNFAKYLVDFFSFSKLTEKNINKLVKVEGIENINKALGVGKGVIALSAHLGSWELGAVAVSLLGFHINAVALSHENTKINRLFVNQRMAKGINVIPVGSGAGEYISVLKKKQMIALVGDRLINDSGEKVQFFGKEVLLPKGPSLLSCRSGAPILPAFIVRLQDDTFRFVFEEPIYPEKFTGNLHEKVHAMVKETVRVMEKFIGQYPSQWFLFNKVWE